MTHRTRELLSKILIKLMSAYLLVFIVFIAIGGLSNKDWPAESKYELRECKSYEN